MDKQMEKQLDKLMEMFDTLETSINREISKGIDKLIMNVYTNGSLRPEEAMALASKILIEHLNIISDLNAISDVTGIIAEKNDLNTFCKFITICWTFIFMVLLYKNNFLLFLLGRNYIYL